MEKKRRILKIQYSWKSLWFIPILLLFVDIGIATVCGFIWLYEHGLFLHSLAVASVCTILGYLAVHFWVKGTPSFEVLDEDYWSNAEKVAMDKVREYVNSLDLKTIEWKDPNTAFGIVRKIANIVAREFRPDRSNPEGDVPLAYLMLMIERLVRDLRHKFVDVIPGTYMLTLNHTLYGYAMFRTYTKLYQIYKWISIPLNPVSGLVRLGRSYLGSKVYQAEGKTMQSNLIRSSLESVGHYAVELYSGRLRLEDEEAQAEMVRARQNYAKSENVVDDTALPVLSKPVQALVLGHSGVGKSSFIQRFFGKDLPAMSPECIVKDTEGYELPKRGFFRSKETTPFAKYFEQIKQADLLFLLVDATQPQEADGAFLKAFDQWRALNPKITPPLLVLAVRGFAVEDEAVGTKLAGVLQSLELAETTPVFAFFKPEEEPAEKETEGTVATESAQTQQPTESPEGTSESVHVHEDICRLMLSSILQELQPELQRIQEDRGCQEVRHHTGVGRTVKQLGNCAQRYLGRFGEKIFGKKAAD